jgi:hypothetical protein
MSSLDADKSGSLRKPSLSVHPPFGGCRLAEALKARGKQRTCSEQTFSEGQEVLTPKTWVMTFETGR